MLTSGSIRSSRMSGFSVAPCTTSVPSTTRKAVSTITFRPGKSCGNANAVASVSSPRMPHHDTTVVSRHGLGSANQVGDPNRG